MNDRRLNATVLLTALLLTAGSALGGGPPNEACGNASIIPGNAVSYNPALLNTTDALTELCGNVESCEIGGGGTTHSVYYSYTPDQDGNVTIGTFGSTYDTVLSVYDGCTTGFFPPCNDASELACNDNYLFGSLSQVNLDVIAGQEYIIKVADAGNTGGLLDLGLIWRPANDNCDDAILACGSSFDPQPFSTVNADLDLCDLDESCETGDVGVSNSVWFLYLPPEDGLLSVNTEGSTYDTVLSVWDGCGQFVAIDTPCITPSQIACDDDGGIGLQSRIDAIPVTGCTSYLIKVADYNTSPGGGMLDFNLSFSQSNPQCASDVNNDSLVNVQDLLQLLSDWGACPN